MLENIGAIERWIDQPEKSLSLDQVQRSALEDLVACVRMHSGEALSAGSREEEVALICEGFIWCQKAEVALERLGYLGSLSVEDVDGLAA